MNPIDKDNEGSEEVYEFYLNGYAGPKSTNYCPIAEFYTPPNGSQNKYYTRSCSDPSTLIDIKYKEELGNNSFCFLSSLVEKNTVTPEVKAVCYKISCEGNSVTIKIGNRYIVCPSEGGKIVVEGFDGYILCPDYYLMYRGTVLCNNLFDCIEKESRTYQPVALHYEWYMDDWGIFQTTQNSSIYSTQNPLNYLYNEETGSGGICPIHCNQCDLESKCISCIPHYKVDPIENKCVEKVKNSNKYDYNDENCIECNYNYFLALEDNGTFVCQENGKEDEYFQPQGTNYYLPCHKGVSNCNKCNSDKQCRECNNGFLLIDNGENCFEINSKLYYLDTDGINKSCTKYNDFQNCLKCELNPDFKCLECISNHIKNLFLVLINRL